MPIGLAIATILSFAVSFWVLHVARDPREWRLWWMDILGVLDVDSDREKRRIQEAQMSVICYVMFVLLLAVSLSGAFWTFDLVREAKREKTRFEREMIRSKREIEKFENMPRGGVR